jgi:hypothetical protein
MPAGNATAAALGGAEPAWPDVACAALADHSASSIVAIATARPPAKGRRIDAFRTMGRCALRRGFR